MAIEKFNNLSPLEKDRFGVIVNTLLNKSFILAQFYDQKNRIPRPNGDYTFLLRYYDIFTEYFAMAKYSLTRDDNKNIVSLSNEEGKNHIQINKIQTKFLVGIKRFYDSSKETNAKSNVVYTTIHALIQSMLVAPALFPKKPTQEEIGKALSFFAQRTIIAKLDKNFYDLSTTIVILPTIDILLSPERVEELLNVLIENTEGEKQDA
ncbi:MAG: DUF4194 domain-containing protein [Bacillales bacterium]|jgi:hypothetical protein|nr:DUF4194 domain-containing protein [Bacillales bacterium]